MLHHFLDDKPWFAPKRYGYGAGLPIVWQGWALLAAYVAALGGIGLLAKTGAAGRGIGFMLFLMITIMLIEICRRRTAGGWKWRWGKNHG